MLEVEKIGFDSLGENTKNEFQKLFDEYSGKIGKKLKKIEFFKIHLKEHSRGGKAIKFSLHIQIRYSGKTLEAKAADWDLKRTIHKVFNKLETEIEHKFHISDQHKQNKSRI